jgi:hypothetical protein
MPALISFDKGWLQLPRHLLPEGGLVDALNVIPTERGAITSRLGHGLYGTVDQQDVHSLFTSYLPDQTLVTYQGAGSKLYRNLGAIVTGLDGFPITFATLRGLGEERTYTFFAANTQEALRLKDDGTTLTRWGLAPPTAPVVSAAGAGAGALNGNYLWKTTFVRKPSVAIHPGAWVNATSTFSSGTSFGLSTVSANDGYLVGGERPFAEVVLSLPTAASGGGIYAYSYWNGTAWIPFTPDILPVLTATGITRFTFSFPTSNWPRSTPPGTFTSLAQPSLYWIRVLATTPPATAAVTNALFAYDSVIAARSNGSPVMAAGVTKTPGTDVTLTVSNPLVAGANFDPQVTHVEVYRTHGNDPAFLNYFFEGDVPAGVTTFSSSVADAALSSELLEEDNDRPPAFTTIADHQDRIFGAVGNRLYFSKRFLPESFPLGNYVEVGNLGDPLRHIAQYDGNLYLFTTARVYLLVGSDEASYDPRQVQCPTGVGSVRSVARGERGVYFLGTDANLWRLQGATVALKLGDESHYPLFHNIVYNGVDPINPLARQHCIAAWYNNRYYFSYPAGSATTPNATFFIDEGTDTWWRDSRGFRALYYDRGGDRFFGSNVQGQIFFLDIQGDTEGTDNGTPILWSAQTRDDDEGVRDQEKELLQVTVDALTSGQTLTVTAIRDYGSSADVLQGTCVTSVRQSTVLSSATAGTPKALAFGYRLSGTAPQAIYRLLPQVLVFPIVRNAFDSLPLNLGWPGRKVVESFLLDLDIRSGTVTCRVYADNTLVETTVLGTLGRQQVQCLTAPHTGTIFQVFLAGTGTFLLYPGSVVAWRRQPPPITNDVLLATDCGYAGKKIGLAYTQDVELLAPGTVTTTFYVDGTLNPVHQITHTALGRGQSQRHRLPAQMLGRLFSIQRQSTAPYALWESDLEWMAFNVGTKQHMRVVDEYGETQLTPLQAA